MADIQLDIAPERIAAGGAAGDNYVAGIESVRNELDADNGSGTSLGKMVKGQLTMTELDTRYQIELGAPMKVAKAVNEAAKAVKSA